MRLVVAALARRVPRRIGESLRRRVAAVPADRRPSRALIAALRVLRVGGIPPDVREVEVLDEPGLRLVAADSYVTTVAYWFGVRRGYESVEVSWWLRLVDDATSVVELGANVGYYSVLAGRRRPGLAYVAVEPHPGSAAALRRNLELNGVGAVVREVAAVPQDLVGTEVVLQVPVSHDHFADAPTGAFVDLGEGVPGLPAGADYSVVEVRPEVVPVRDVVGPDVDLLKIDVEGLEHRLLADLLPVLAESRPTILVEVLDRAGDLRAWIATELLPLGYRAHAPEPGRLRPLDATEIAGLGSDASSDVRDVVLTVHDVTGWEPVR